MAGSVASKSRDPTAGSVSIGRRGLMPGLALCLGIALVARLVQALEESAFSHPYLEGLVVAILLGMAVRTVWNPGEQWGPVSGSAQEPSWRSQSCCSGRPSTSAPFWLPGLASSSGSPAW